MSFIDIVLAVCIIAILALAVRSVVRKGGACDCGCCAMADTCKGPDRCTHPNERV